MARFTINAEELETLPEAHRGKFTEVEDEDGNVAFEYDGPPTDLIEDTTGLKSALEKTKGDREKLSKGAKKTADAEIILAATELNANVHVAPSVVRDHMEWSKEHGAYIRRAEDGEPLLKENGELYSVKDFLREKKSDENFESLFKFRSSHHTGTGTQPGTQGGRSSGRGTAREGDGLPSKSTSRRSMTREQKVAIINAGEDLEDWPL